MPLPGTDASGRVTERPANTIVAGAGTVIGNAAALSYGFQVVTGGNDTVGVQLPAPYPGAICEVYNQDTNGTHGLKCYPPVNAAINNGTANAAVAIEGWTLAVFRGTSGTGWAAQYTANS